MSSETETTAGRKGYVFEIVKAVVIALVLSLVFVLIAAFAIKFFNIRSEGVV